MNESRASRSAGRGSKALESYWKAWRKLAAMSDEELEGARADRIRDNSDRHWFALTRADHDELKRRIAEHKKLLTGGPA